MECAVGCIDQNIGVLLSAYEFGRLTDPEKEQFETHMAACSACREEVSAMRPVWQMLRAHPKIFKETRSASWLAFGLKPAMALAALLLLALGLGYWRQPAAWHVADALAIEENGQARFRTVAAGLDSGLRAFQARDLAAAKEKFQAVCNQEPKNYQAQYYLGFCYLHTADHGILWTRKINEADLTQALDALGRAAALAQGKDPVFQARTHLAMAKAYLLKNQTTSALEELGQVENVKGPDTEIGALKRSAGALKTKIQ